MEEYNKIKKILALGFINFLDENRPEGKMCLFGDKEAIDLQHFIRSIVKPTTNLAEWSEEDEHRRKDAIYFLESAKKHYADTSEIEKTISWLKFLRPQSKQDVLPSLSEKEIICLKRALDYLRKEHNRYGGEDFTNEIAVLEWFITHPILVSDTHWKPSKEQMKQLKDAADLPEFGPMVTTRKQFPDLESLYEQLINVKQWTNGL